MAFRTTPEPWWGVCYRTLLQSWGFVGMGGIPNTVRRGGVYHFRRAIPVGLRVRLARSELTCSLHTHQAEEARFLSRCLYLRSEELFVMIGSAPMLSKDDVAALVKDFYSTILAQDDNRRLMSDGPDRLRKERAEYHRKLAESAREHLAEDAYATVRMITSSMLARRYGLDAKFDDRSVREVGQAMLRACVAPEKKMKTVSAGFPDRVSAQPRSPTVGPYCSTDRQIASLQTGRIAVR